MVSRFPVKGSPLEASPTMSNAIPLATFNMPVTKDQLVDKVDVVAVFGNNNPITLHAYPAPNQEVANSRLVVTDSNEQPTFGGEILIDGDTLKLDADFADSVALIFDIDYNNQHRKFFEKTTGVYLLKFPYFVAQQGSDPAGWYYPVVYVANHLEETEVAIAFYVPDDQNLVPVCAKADYTDIDVADWIAGMSMAKVSLLIQELMRLEYNLPDAVTIDVTADPSQVSTIQGDWNLFTDGSVYVPLVMTSRFPNGAPIILDNTEKIIASFNRQPKIYELAGSLNFVLGSDHAVNSGIAEIDSDDLILKYGGSAYSAAYIIISGSNVLVKKYGSMGVPDVFDVDYNYQHQRPLTPPSSDTPLMFECANPDILGVGGDSLDLFMSNILGDQRILVVTNSGGTEVMGSSGQLPPRSYQDTPSLVLALLNHILEMEFSNYDDFTTDTEIYADEPISGTVDLLTVSTVTPA